MLNEAEGPVRDAVRLQALRKADLLDTPAEAAFDRITRLAARVLRVPVALVSLVDRDRQFFKSCVGLPEPWASQRQTPLSHSFCQHAVVTGEPLIIPDAREHPLVRDNLAIRDLGVIAYAGIPLRTDGGAVLGSFCAIDTRPRQWTDEEVQILEDLASSVMSEIALRSSAADLREREEQLRLAVEATELGTYDWDVVADTLTWSARLKAIFGLPPDAPANMHLFYERLHPGDRARIAGLLRDCLDPARRAPVDFQYRVVRPGGAVRWVDARGKVFFQDCDGGPRAARIIGTVRDVTAARDSEEELRKANEASEAAHRAKDRFMAVLSHELRTPLSPALLTAAAMASDPTLPEGVRQDAQLIQRNIESQTRLIDDLLDVTRIANGKLAMELSEVDAAALLAQAVEQYRGAAAGKQVEVRLATNSTLRTVRGDPLRLQQVFSNLLGNAIKFTPAGGSVSVRTSDAPGGQLRVEVADTGVGVEAGVLPRMFDAFEQGHGAVTRRFGGLGLGLAICKGIVEAHGGRIHAASEGPGRGTTMTVELPAVAAATTGDGAAVAAGPARGRPPLRILLVDDHKDTLRAMSALLRKLNHRVTAASTVNAALEAAAAATFDVVISDVGLPDGTGLDLMRQLLAKSRVAGIAVTGYGMHDDVQMTRDAGFMSHLTKPVSFQDLQAALEKVGG